MGIYMTRRHIDTRAGEKIIALQPAIKGSLLDSLMVGALTALFNATEQPPYERIKKNIDDIVRLHPVNMGAISRASVNESEKSFQISFGEMIPVIDVVHPNQPNVYQPLYLRFEYDGNSFVFENARIPVLISSEHTGAHFVRRAGDILDPKDESFYESLLIALLITQSFEQPILWFYANRDHGSTKPAQCYSNDQTIK